MTFSFYADRLILGTFFDKVFTPLMSRLQVRFVKYMWQGLKFFQASILMLLQAFTTNIVHSVSAWQSVSHGDQTSSRQVGSQMPYPPGLTFHCRHWWWNYSNKYLQHSVSAKQNYKNYLLNILLSECLFPCGIQQYILHVKLRVPEKLLLQNE